MGAWPDGLVATDIATEMCVVGKRAVPGVQWRVMSAEQPLRGPWDWMFSSAMLQWMKTPEEILTAWKEQLAPGGRVVASLFCAGSLPEWRLVAGKFDPICWRTAVEWRAILAGAGLRLLRDEVQTRTFRYSSARDFLRSLHGVGAAPQRRLTAWELRRLLDEMDRGFGGIQGVPATWVFYRFEAERS
jgi:SAM-dependent methyltransferase